MALLELEGVDILLMMNVSKNVASEKELKATAGTSNRLRDTPEAKKQYM